MERTSNNIIQIILLVFIICLIIVGTTLKVYNNHTDGLYRVANQKIEDAAKECNIEGVCENTITLGFLIEKGYLEAQVHPVTKEFISNDLVITCENYVCKTNIE